MPAPGPPVAAPIAAVVMPPVAPPVPAPVVPAPVVPTPVVPTIAAIPVAIAIAAIILRLCRGRARPHGGDRQAQGGSALPQDVHEIGRASCRARVGQYVWISVFSVYLKKKQQRNK